MQCCDIPVMSLFRAIAMPTCTAYDISAEQFKKTRYINGIWIFTKGRRDV